MVLWLPLLWAHVVVQSIQPLFLGEYTQPSFMLEVYVYRGGCYDTRVCILSSFPPIISQTPNYIHQPPVYVTHSPPPPLSLPLQETWDEAVEIVETIRWVTFLPHQTERVVIFS